MNTMHDEQSHAAPYALGALDPAERRAFVAHLAVCPVCREEVLAFGQVADALAHAVPQRTPRAELRARVLANATGRTPEGVRHVHSGSSLYGWLPLAAAAVLAVGLGAYTWNLQGRVSGLEARLRNAEARADAAGRETIEARAVADRAQSAMAVLAAPDLARIDLAGQAVAPAATGRALWSRSRGMFFTSSNLPPAPAGRVYQVWVVTAQSRVSAGVIDLDETGHATAYFNTPPDIPAPVAVAVTLEPSPGVPQPTGDMYLVGKPGAS
jgi:anti-sigma-K factor RskA